MPASSSTERTQTITALYREHHELLRRIVWLRASRNDAIIDDACSHAWAQLVAHDSFDLTAPDRATVAWLATTAIRQAWLLENHARRLGTGHDSTALEQLAGVGPSADELAEQHQRLQLLTDVPRRPRRFLLRLALGYSYEEIAAIEHVSLTTTNKQLARARRILRTLRERDAAGGESDGAGD